jgi:hypothetical protein
MFIGYAFLLGLILISSFFIWPDKAYQPSTSSPSPPWRASHSLRVPHTHASYHPAVPDANAQSTLLRSDSEDSLNSFEEVRASIGSLFSLSVVVLSVVRRVQMETEEERKKRLAQERLTALKGRSFWQQLFSAPWWINAVFTAVNIFGLQYYISTGPDQLLRIGDVGSFTLSVLSSRRSVLSSVRARANA